ncbi:SufS family cysteine desulfurase [Gammaproteobacteria bacterium]|nr:SufS family cysteine desulfurase [Gammaproteobacteria bacterium]
MITSPWRADFPILSQTVHGQRWAYLDHAATAQKPQAVLDRMMQFYQHDYANTHRGAHAVSERATGLFEQARTRLAEFIHADDASEVVWVRGATEGVNLVASVISHDWQAGDEIIITQMEHHANWLPWQHLAASKGLKLRVIGLTDDFQLDWPQGQTLFNKRTKLLAISHMSNVFGAVNDLEPWTDLAHSFDAAVLVDGAQSILHQPVDVQALGCDFFVFSSHKLYGPTGIGVVYGKAKWWDRLPPYQVGGAMMQSISPDKIDWQPPPLKFEAGTPAIAQAVGLHAAVDYIEAIGFDKIMAHEQQLMDYVLAQLEQINVKVWGPKQGQTGVIAFSLDQIHAQDVAMVLDRQGVAIRAGHHCAMPLIESMGQTSIARASFGLYTDQEDLDQWLTGLDVVRSMFA